MLTADTFKGSTMKIWEIDCSFLVSCPYSEFSGPYFPAFGLDTGKIRITKTPNMEFFTQ